MSNSCGATDCPLVRVCALIAQYTIPFKLLNNFNNQTIYYSKNHKFFKNKVDINNSKLLVPGEKNSPEIREEISIGSACRFGTFFRAAFAWFSKWMLILNVIFNCKHLLSRKRYANMDINLECWVPNYFHERWIAMYQSKGQNFKEFKVKSREIMLNSKKFIVNEWKV